MSNSRIHIDQLFAKGLENLEIPISSNTFENIRQDITSDGSESLSDNKPFDNFELEVTDADWQIIKERLAKAIASDPINKVTTSLQELELEVTQNDWHILKDKLATQTRQPVIPLPVNDIQASFKDFEIAVTDADWQATKSKLNDFNKKKMVWWWWLNIVILGSLIGLAMQYFAPLNTSSLANLPSASITKLEAGTNIPKNSSNQVESNVVIEKEAIDNNQNTITNKVENNLGDKTAAQPRSTANLFSEKATLSAWRKNNASKSESSKRQTPVKNASSNPANQPVDEPIKNEITKPVDENANTNNAQDITNMVKAENIIVPSANQSEPVDKDDNKTSPDNVVIVEPKKDIPSDNLVNAIDTPKKDAVTQLTPPPVLPKPTFKYYAGIVTDIALTDRYLSKENSESYNAIRNNADKPIIQFSYGITAGLQKGKNQFQTGFQLTQQNFTSTYDYTLMYRDSLAFIVFPSGQKIMIPIGPLKEKRVNETNNIVIKKIEIPFTYNRFWKLDAKTQLITGMSGVLSINTKTEGTKMLNPMNNQLYFYNSVKGFENNLGLSPGINLGMQRNIGKSLMIQANAFGKYSVTNRYNDNFSMKEYPYSNDNITLTAKEYLYSYGLSLKLLYLLN